MTSGDRVRLVHALPSVELWRSLPDPIASIRDTWPRPTPHFEVVVVGLPAPQGSKVPGGRAADGHITMRESSKSVGPWRECVERASLRLISPDGEGRTIIPGFPLKGPLAAEMVFTLSKPTTSPKRRRVWPAKQRHDATKLARSTEDALVTSGVIKDDGFIVEYIRLVKVYPLEDRDALATTGAIIRIWSVDLLT